MTASTALFTVAAQGLKLPSYASDLKANSHIWKQVLLQIRKLTYFVSIWLFVLKLGSLLNLGSDWQLGLNLVIVILFNGRIFFQCVTVQKRMEEKGPCMHANIYETQHNIYVWQNIHMPLGMNVLSSAPFIYDDWMLWLKNKFCTFN